MIEVGSSGTIMVFSISRHSKLRPYKEDFEKIIFHITGKYVFLNLENSYY